jgi:hypothetical protein
MLQSEGADFVSFATLIAGQSRLEIDFGGTPDYHSASRNAN